MTSLPFTPRAEVSPWQTCSMSVSLSESPIGFTSSSGNHSASRFTRVIHCSTDSSQASIVIRPASTSRARRVAASFWGTSSEPDLDSRTRSRNRLSRRATTRLAAAS